VKVAAENIFVFMHTNTFNDGPSYSNGASAPSLASMRIGRFWSASFHSSKLVVAFGQSVRMASTRVFTESRDLLNSVILEKKRAIIESHLPHDPIATQSIGGPV
jgi:hypothetical protein